jgi:hypothetical protein
MTVRVCASQPWRMPGSRPIVSTTRSRTRCPPNDVGNLNKGHRGHGARVGHRDVRDARPARPRPSGAASATRTVVGFRSGRSFPSARSADRPLRPRANDPRGNPRQDRRPARRPRRTRRRGAARTATRPDHAPRPGLQPARHRATRCAPGVAGRRGRRRRSGIVCRTQGIPVLLRPPAPRHGDRPPA